MKKLFILKTLFLLAGLIFFQIHQALAQQVYLAISEAEKSSSFSDNFDNNNNQWITDNLWISGKIENGFYNIICKNYNMSTGLAYKSIPVVPNQDYEIEASIKIIRGTGALVFGMTDKFDHYRIEITDNNSLEIIKDTPSKKKKVEKLFTSAANANIKKDTYNKLTFRYITGTYYLFINEVFVIQFINIIPEGNQIGFNVGTDSEISVDYLRLSMIKQATPAQPIVAQQEPIIQKPPVVETARSVTPDLSATTGLNMTTGPLVTWIAPSGQKTTLQSFTANIKAYIKSSSGVKSVLFYLNGVAKGEGEVKPVAGQEGSYNIDKTMTFGPGENNVYFIAANNEGATKSELRYFTNPSAVAPVVTWSNPVNPNSIVATESFPITACIKSPSELKSIRLLVNGSTQTEDNVFQATNTGDDCNYIWQGSVVLKDGDNSIFLIASNAAGSTTSEKRLIKLDAGLAEKRLALVFGNAEYRNNTVLKNPVNDANLMEGTLKELGFEVIKKLNAGRDEMMKAIREFNEKLPDYNVALFYYAGHGNQVDGKNYMIPTDALLEKPTDARFEAIGVDFVVEEFERYPDNTNIVILDACRNNPYAAWARGGEAGFKAINFSSGTIISFATSEGKTAADGKGANGLFTEELVKQMAVPQSVFNVFMKTRNEVKRLSNGQQVPMEWNKLNGDFYFKK